MSVEFLGAEEKVSVAVDGEWGDGTQSCGQKPVCGGLKSWAWVGGIEVAKAALDSSFQRAFFGCWFSPIFFFSVRLKKQR